MIRGKRYPIGPTASVIATECLGICITPDSVLSSASTAWPVIVTATDQAGVDEVFYARPGVFYQFGSEALTVSAVTLDGTTVNVIVDIALEQRDFVNLAWSATPFRPSSEILFSFNSSSGGTVVHPVSPIYYRPSWAVGIQVGFAGRAPAAGTLAFRNCTNYTLEFYKLIAGVWVRARPEQTGASTIGVACDTAANEGFTYTHLFAINNPQVGDAYQIWGQAAAGFVADPAGLQPNNFFDVFIRWM